MSRQENEKVMPAEPVEEDAQAGGGAAPADDAAPPDKKDDAKIEKTPEIPMEEIKQAAEALIFVSPQGIAARKLAERIGCPPSQVQRAAEELAAEYRVRRSGLDIIQVAAGYQLVTVSEMAPLVEKHLTVVKKRHLSQPALETLSIIAYRQPVTRVEIEAIRGVDTGGVLAGLLEKKYIRIAGRKKVPGKPLLYATTKDFLFHFGLKDLNELPALAELGRPPEEVEIEESPGQGETETAAASQGTETSPGETAAGGENNRTDRDEAASRKTDSAPAGDGAAADDGETGFED